MKFATHIKVSNTGNHYETTGHVGDHIITTDEPLDHGGTNKGPTAHQLLLTSLGACTAVTLRMYADRKEWDVKKIHVYLNMEKVDVFSGDPEKPVREEITKIYQRIEFEGDLNEEQIKRLMAISEKCPVHKTLTGKVIIEPLES
jgi:putative redox protein